MARNPNQDTYAIQLSDMFVFNTVCTPTSYSFDQALKHATYRDGVLYVDITIKSAGFYKLEVEAIASNGQKSNNTMTLQLS